jgi:hypothetical protein
MDDLRKSSLIIDLAAPVFSTTSVVPSHETHPSFLSLNRTQQMAVTKVLTAND